MINLNFYTFYLVSRYYFLLTVNIKINVCLKQTEKLNSFAKTKKEHNKISFHLQ